MTLALLAHLQSLDIKVAIGPDGRLTYNAPAHVLSDELLERMRSNRQELLALLKERTESSYLQPIASVVCPWCNSDDHFTEKANGLWCGRCERLSFLFTRQAIVRADWKAPILL